MIRKTMLSTRDSDLSRRLPQLLEENAPPAALASQLAAYHERDIAESLPTLTREQCQRILGALPAETLAKILEYAQEPEIYFSQLGIRQKTQVLSFLETATAAEILASLPKDTRTALLELTRPDIREELRLVGSFPEEQIGSKMSTNFITIPQNATIKEAMSELVTQAAENDNISTLYVVDENRVFCGSIDLKDLITARQGTPLAQITTNSYPYLYARTETEDCLAFLRSYSESSIPVLDDEGRILGVVTARDLIELLGEEWGEDYAKLGGLSSEEDLSEPVLRSVRKRSPWLCALLALGLGVSAVVGLFEEVVAQLPIIMCFQSLVLDMAGNVGTQSLAVAIRVLMDPKIGGRQKWQLVFKETRVGLLGGILLGLLSFAAIGGYLWLKGNAPAFAFAVSGCLGTAMVLAMGISSLAGTVIPLFFQKVGVDPAVASGPLITTVNDLVAVVSYYGLAWLLLVR